jgi:hypothetical protein
MQGNVIKQPMSSHLNGYRRFLGLQEKYQEENKKKKLKIKRD